MSGAAPLSSELIGQLAYILPSSAIGQGYGITYIILVRSFTNRRCAGMTETCTAVTLTSASRWVDRSGSVGTLLPGVVARVVKADGTLAKPGESGEMIVHSPSNALGYVGNEKEYVFSKELSRLFFDYIAVGQVQRSQTGKP